MSFMISPPCTLPQGFASDGSIARAMTVRDADTGRASIVINMPPGGSAPASQIPE